MADEYIDELYEKMMKAKTLEAIEKLDFNYFNLSDDSLGEIKRIKIMQLSQFLNKQKKPSKEKLCWITISKSNCCSVIEFVKAVHNLPAYRITSNKFSYCFESTGYENDEYQNVHCHYLCVKQVGINQEKYISRLKTTLKEKAFNINFKSYPLDMYDDKVKYQNGLKDADQDEKPEITKAFREKYNIAPIYHFI